MNKKQKKLFYRILIAAVLLVVSYLIHALLAPKFPISLIIFLPPYLIAGYDVLLEAAIHIRHGHIFDENFLMCIATIGALVIGEYPEAVFVMVFYQAGELFQSIAVGKSRSSISSLMELCPESATVIRDGKSMIVDPSEVLVGETLSVMAGEKIPIDGIVIEGSSSVDTSALTGESLPRHIEVGDNISGGCINLSSPIKIKTETDYDNSTVAKILELIENAASSKAVTERFITRFARYYTPCVVIGALLLALIPGFITGEFAEWLHRALIFLVISCPCALVISVPLSFFGGIGAAGKRGILVKGSNYLELLSKTDTVVFDKTGTLTMGAFSVTEAVAYQNGNPCSNAQSIDHLYSLTALLEANSNHPIARSIIEAYNKKYNTIPREHADNVTEHAGRGLSAIVNKKRLLVGNAKLMCEYSIAIPEITTEGSVIYTAYDKELLGYFIICDTEKKTSAQAINVLKSMGVKRIVMLTGDREQTAERIAKRLGIDEYHASLLPADKVHIVEKMLNEMPKNKKLAFVGDGINDAPVLARSDLGIAMGALGSDAAIEAADIVLMDDDPLKLTEAIRISKKTNIIVMQNIIFALGIKVIFLAMGAFGIANLWEAVFADVGVAVIAILNAMRTLKAPNK